MKFWSAKLERHVEIDKSLIRRSHVKVPNQSEPVPIQSMEPDIRDQFMEDVMKSDEISEETKKNLERRCGKERRVPIFRQVGKEIKWHDDKRRQYERRGRKTAEDIVKLVNIGCYECGGFGIGDAQKILKFLNYE